MGAETAVTWKRTRGALLPTRMRTGAEEVQVEWKALGEDRWFPSKLGFVDVLTTAEHRWGPEQLRLTDLAVDERP